MVTVLAQMGLLILCGVAWRIIKPGGLSAEQTRLVLTALVFNLLLPALVLSVLWQAEVGNESLRLASFSCIVVVAGALLTWLVSKLIRIGRRQLGAAMLGIAFPNVTYIGLPVLEQVFGPWTRSLVVQIDFFGATPLVCTLGIWIGRHYGEAKAGVPDSMLAAVVKNPPLWAAVLALVLNLNGAVMPHWLAPLLDRLSAAVIPLMLMAIGLGLSWGSWNWRNLPLASLVLVFKLALVPVVGVMAAWRLGFSGDTLNALVLEAAMPSMLLGIVYCDRYRLDTAFYAMIVALTTVGAMFSLPAWHEGVEKLPF